MKFVVTILAALAIAASAAAQQTKPGDLVPIEQGTADTSAMQTTLRVMPVELSESTNFARLYGVAGRPDLLVRSHGGTYAVFDQGQYVNWKGRSLPVWPSGTQFFIGRPDFSRVHSSGIRMGEGSNMLSAPGIDVVQRKGDLRAPDTRRRDERPPVPGDARVPDQRLHQEPVDNRVGAKPAVKQTKAPGSADRAPQPTEPAQVPATDSAKPEPEGKPAIGPVSRPAPPAEPRPATTP